MKGWEARLSPGFCVLAGVLGGFEATKFGHKFHVAAYAGTSYVSIDGHAIIVLSDDAGMAQVGTLNFG